MFINILKYSFVIYKCKLLELFLLLYITKKIIIKTLDIIVISKINFLKITFPKRLRKGIYLETFIMEYILEGNKGWRGVTRAPTNIEDEELCNNS